MTTSVSRVIDSRMSSESGGVTIRPFRIMKNVAPLPSASWTLETAEFQMAVLLAISPANVGAPLASFSSWLILSSASSSRFWQVFTRRMPSSNRAVIASKGNSPESICSTMDSSFLSAITASLAD